MPRMAFFLPDDILGIILGKLYIGDRVRLRLVCKTWNHILIQDGFPTAPEAPWQILSADSYDKPESNLSEICFKSLSEERIYRFKLPSFDVHDQGGVCWCCGSSRGWLAMVVGPDMKPDMFLWNPISGATRKLPPLSTLSFFDEFVAIDSNVIKRVEVFTLGSVECVVAVLFQSRRIALCTPRETKWTTVAFNAEANTEYITNYEDIMFHAAAANATGYPGKLMLLAKENFPSETERKTFLSKARLEVSLTDCQIQVDTVLIPVNDNSLELTVQRGDGFVIPERTFTRWLLVESSVTGQVLLVSAESQILISCPHSGCLMDDFVYVQITGMSVRSHEMAAMKKEALFFGDTGCVSLVPMAREIVPDCIYFATDSFRVCSRNSRNADHMFCIREYGQFFVSRNKLCLKSATAIKVPHRSKIGWFTP